LTALIDNGVFDLGQEKTVTNFKKVNQHETSVIQIKHEEEFRSLVYVGNANLMDYERKLEVKARDSIHYVAKFYLKRNGKVLGEVSLLRLCNLSRVDRQDINNLLNMVEFDDDKDYLEDISSDGLMQSLVNTRTIQPNFFYMIFLVSPSPKLYDQSSITLKIAEQFCSRLGKTLYSADK
jgi:hypothetical protein